MESFPLLQNSASCNPLPRDLRLLHNLDLINGIRVVRDTFSSANSKEEDFIIYDPAWTYGEDKINYLRQEKLEEPRFVPNYVIFAQKCLKFDAFFRQNVDSFLNQRSSLRHVVIYYFLENDTMSVTEPVVVNAGCKQGKLVKRSKIPKNDNEFYHWKDLNVGKNINIYGIIYQITDCDSFTRNFLTSQGIDVKAKQDLVDLKPELSQRERISKPQVPQETYYRPRNWEEILIFVASWNDDKYAILYHLVDDTILVRRMPRSKDDDDPMNKLLLRRMRVMKEKRNDTNRYIEEIGTNQPSTDEFKFTDKEVEYYSPLDFQIGKTIMILGRPFLLIDCTESTRRFYSNKLGINQPSRISDQPRTAPSLEKTFQSRTYDQPFCKRAYSGVTKRDAVIRQLLDLNVKLRYQMMLDAVYPEEVDRKFIMEYNLNDGTMAINEIETNGPKRITRGFLSPVLVAKPDSTEEDPDYYSERDFYIGAKINVFNRRFIITGADLAVWKYIQEHSNDFNEKVYNSMKEHFSKNATS